MEKTDRPEILIVEDSRTQALKFQLMLENQGYFVQVAQNGIEAMNILLNNHISIVITDWVMPEMDGSELCRAIRQHDFGGYVYIIMLTAREKKIDIIEGLKAGADDYLIKPVDEAELMARLMTAERIISLEQTLKRRNQEIALLSITDPLTRVFNRGYFNDNFPLAFKRAARYQNPISLAICDIDYFKRINDKYGHQAGDKVLVKFALHLKDALRQDIDWIARYGGEEFVIVLPDTDPEGGKKAAERFRKIIENMEVEVNGEKLTITASFGVAGITSSSDTNSITPDLVINTADRCLYQAKEAGRNRTVGEAL